MSVINDATVSYRKITGKYELLSLLRLRRRK